MEVRVAMVHGEREREVTLTRNTTATNLQVSSDAAPPPPLPPLLHPLSFSLSLIRRNWCDCFGKNFLCAMNPLP